MRNKRATPVQVFSVTSFLLALFSGLLYIIGFEIDFIIYGYIAAVPLLSLAWIMFRPKEHIEKIRTDQELFKKLLEMSSEGNNEIKLNTINELLGRGNDNPVDIDSLTRGLANHKITVENHEVYPIEKVSFVGETNSFHITLNEEVRDRLKR